MFIFDRTQKQIGTIYSFFPNQVQVLQPGVAYDVFIFAGHVRQPFTLKVMLPGTFPDVAPIITVSPPVNHRWVSHDMRIVGHENLAVWHRNYALGKILKDIEIEFGLRPPSVISSRMNRSASIDGRKLIKFEEVDSMR